uniref:DUF569 domain-containing protein n=1 Tax=Kalanchoe fedtschenkoi TaxID=63787 RepID=A0A7N0RF78_KALFE
MDMFRRAKTVRLRSHHDKYLLADEDRESVCQERDGTNKRASWHIEPVDGSNLIRLQSCYGKYLTASDESQYLGMTGKRVLQTIPKRLDSSIEWEPIREGVQVKLRSRYGHFLRANGGLPPWRNSITHDIPHRSATQDWILWEVDVLQRREDDKKASPRPDPIVLPPRSNPVSRSASSESDLFMSAYPSPKRSPKKSPRWSPRMSPRHQVITSWSFSLYRSSVGVAWVSRLRFAFETSVQRSVLP